MENAPQDEANQHGFLRGDDFSHHAGNPCGERRRETVKREGERGFSRREAQRLNIVRQECQLETIARHKDRDSDIPPDQTQG